MSTGVYVAACVVVPLAWGMIVVWVSNRIDAWAKRRMAGNPGNAVHRDDSTRIEYHI